MGLMRKPLAWMLPFLLAAAVVPAPAVADETGLRGRLETLSAAGNAEAAYHLGMLHHLGLEGTTQDLRKAFELFRLSAQGGDPLGSYKLGCFYAGQGEGVVEPDETLALRYKLVAAEAGYALAQEEVAGIYFRRGDAETGLRWLERAARQGGFSALMMLGALYSGLIPEVGVEKDAVRNYAYTMLSLGDSDDEFAAMREEMEREMRAKMSTAQMAEAEAMIAGWRASPSALTLKAGAGLEAAQQLAGLSKPE